MNQETHPLASLDEWEDDLLLRYPANSGGGPQATKKFRDYAAQARESVKQFYELNHRFQTFDFVQAKRTQ